MTIEGSTIANNGTFGVVASGANATARLVNSVVSGNARGLIATTSGSIVSQGGNVVAGTSSLARPPPPCRCNNRLKQKKPAAVSSGAATTRRSIREGPL